MFTRREWHAGILGLLCSLLPSKLVEAKKLPDWMFPPPPNPVPPAPEPAKPKLPRLDEFDQISEYTDLAMMVEAEAREKHISAEEVLVEAFYDALRIFSVRNVDEQAARMEKYALWMRPTVNILMQHFFGELMDRFGSCSCVPINENIYGTSAFSLQTAFDLYELRRVDTYYAVPSPENLFIRLHGETVFFGPLHRRCLSMHAKTRLAMLADCSTEPAVVNKARMYLRSFTTPACMQWNCIAVVSPFMCLLIRMANFRDVLWPAGACNNLAINLSMFREQACGWETADTQPAARVIPGVVVNVPKLLQDNFKPANVAFTPEGYVNETELLACWLVQIPEIEAKVYWRRLRDLNPVLHSLVRVRFREMRQACD